MVRSLPRNSSRVRPTLAPSRSRLMAIRPPTSCVRRLARPFAGIGGLCSWHGVCRRYRKLGKYWAEKPDAKVRIAGVNCDKHVALCDQNGCADGRIRGFCAHARTGADSRRTLPLAGAHTERHVLTLGFGRVHSYPTIWVFPKGKQGSARPIPQLYPHDEKTVDSLLEFMVPYISNEVTRRCHRPP
jgi:hypothetical protein